MWLLHNIDLYADTPDVSGEMDGTFESDSFSPADGGSFYGYVQLLEPEGGDSTLMVFGMVKFLLSF